MRLYSKSSLNRYRYETRAVLVNYLLFLSVIMLLSLVAPLCAAADGVGSCYRKCGEELEEFDEKKRIEWGGKTLDEYWADILEKAKERSYSLYKYYKEEELEYRKKYNREREDFFWKCYVECELDVIEQRIKRSQEQQNQCIYDHYTGMYLC